MSSSPISVSYTHLDVYKRQALGYLSADEAVKRSDAVWNSLDALRCGYFGQRRKDSKDYMLKKGTEVIG